MDLQAILEEVRAEIEPHLGHGEVADYIPALARIDPRRFGLAVTTVEGERFAVGDADEPFSIQSISKIFTLTLALECVGARLWDRVGREPSGTPFNSLVQLEYERGVPRNPFVNAGALVVTDVVLTHCDAGTSNPRPAAEAPASVAPPAAAAVAEVLDFVRLVADDPTIDIDEEVARSEKEWGYRNVALANLIKSFGRFDNGVDAILDLYFHQCAIAMSCAQLSRAALYLAHGGRDPLSGRRVVSPQRARRINSIMLTCGHYDASGDFAFRVGLPGKSGVGGGIVAVVPDRMAVAVWSPALNRQGSSLAGTLALEKLTTKAGLSVF